MSTDSRARPRIVSLDVFRGLAIVAMIVVNNPGDRAVTWAQLLHSTWHGWTFADTIFPAFLWIVGVSLVLSLDSRVTHGASRARILGHAAWRAALLVACGLLVEGFPYFELAHFQFTGVLQKIAIAYFFACAICLYTGPRGRMLAVASLLAAYFCFMLLGQAPGCGQGPWSPECNAARHLDDAWLGAHVWDSSMHNDADGVVGSLAAIASVLLGVIAGQWLLPTLKAGARMPWARLAGFALVLVVAGQVLSAWVPINKILWTPSYALLMAGLSCAAFLGVFWVVEERGVRRWSRPFEIFGCNALVAYIASRFGAGFLKMHLHRWSIYHDLLLPIGKPAVASLAFALLNVLAVFVLVWFLFRRRVFVKL